MRGSRNNLLAGAFVLGAILVALSVVIVLGGLRERLNKHEYVVRFDLIEGVMGLEEGSRIFVGGRPIGVVGGFRFEEAQDDSPRAVLVTISVDRSIRFKEGAKAYLLSPLLGGSGTINFPSVGDGRELSESDHIDGLIAPPSLLASAGYGPEEASKVRNIIDQVNAAAGKAATFVDEARGVTSDVKVVTADVREKWPTWSGRVDSITNNVDTAAAKFPDAVDAARARLEEFRGVIDTINGYLAENRENVREAIASFRRVGGEAEKFALRLNDELAGKAAGFLDDGRSALAKGGAVLDDIQGVVSEHSPTIRRAMANFRLASDQLAATLQEVRRSPWRLLYRPDRRELEFELLYDAARAYAGAVGDLRSTSEAIQSLRNGSVGGGIPDAEARLGVLLGELETQFTRYKEAEQEFLRQLMIKSEGK
ncbi:MAG: hypothetical protein SFZ24_00225 [Planctomycetota bacterium]|nr:hypothetical protein [Planctomycetota bacterium]